MSRSLKDLLQSVQEEWPDPMLLIDHSLEMARRLRALDEYTRSPGWDAYDVIHDVEAILNGHRDHYHSIGGECRGCPHGKA